MAAPHEIAAYRDAGHSVTETCEYFGIKARAVYKACQLARAHRPAGAPGTGQAGTRPPHRYQPAQRRINVQASSSAQPMAKSMSEPEPDLSEMEPANDHFRDVASDDDVAGDTTYWKCPVTGELMPIIPGVGRKTWHAERIALHQRLAQIREPGPAAPALDAPSGALPSAPAPAPVPQHSALQSESAPVPVSETEPGADAPSTPAPVVLGLPDPIMIVKRYPLPQQVGPTVTLRMALGEYLPPPNIILALAVVLMLILVCSW